MKPTRILLGVAAVALLTFAGFSVYAAQIDTVRMASWPDAFMKMNGSPILRAVLTPDATTAESNLTAAGGTAATYTLFGGERLCVQAITTDAYVEVIAAASYTAANAKAFFLDADAPLWANCFTLQTGETSVSSLCSAAGPCLVKVFELR